MLVLATLVLLVSFLYPCAASDVLTADIASAAATVDFLNYPNATSSPSDMISLLKRRRSISEDRQTTGLYVCYQMERKIGSKVVYSRGCARTGTSEEDTCKTANDGVRPQWCSLCTSDKCNPAVTMIAQSHIILLAAFSALSVLVQFQS